MKTHALPPSLNKGAVNTIQEGLIALVDWFQGTIHHVSDFREIIEILGLKEENFSETHMGAYGWTSCVRFNNIAIFHGGNVQKGFHLEMRGQGCRQLEEFTNKSWLEIAQDLLTVGFKASRVDLAIDDFGREGRGGSGRRPFFTVGTLIRKAKEGLCRSKFLWGRSLEKIKLDDGSIRGKTLYLGSGSSRIQIRFYEKHWERLNKGYELTDDVEVWNRSEIEARKERAQHIVEKIASGEPLGRLICGILTNYVNFLTPDPNDSNKGRWDLWQNWAAFIGEVEKVSLSDRPPDPSLLRSNFWVDRQVKKTLAKLWLAHSGDYEWLYKLIGEAAEDLSTSDEKQLREQIPLFKQMIEIWDQQEKEWSKAEKRKDDLRRENELADLVKRLEILERLEERGEYTQKRLGSVGSYPSR